MKCNKCGSKLQPENIIIIPFVDGSGKENDKFICEFCESEIKEIQMNYEERYKKVEKSLQRWRDIWNWIVCKIKEILIYNIFKNKWKKRIDYFNYLKAGIVMTVLGYSGAIIVYDLLDIKAVVGYWIFLVIYTPLRYIVYNKLWADKR